MLHPESCWKIYNNVIFYVFTEYAQLRTGAQRRAGNQRKGAECGLNCNKNYNYYSFCLKPLL